MQTEYNLDFLLENTGCYESDKIETLFPKEREVISYKDILQSNIPLGDKYWFFCNRVFTDSQNQHLAIKIAEVVLPIFEEQCPEDNRPRKAIEAARLYLAGEIGKEELEAAWAAWDAAGAAAWGAWDAARTAAWAARTAARDANPKYTKELEELLENFIEDSK
jgi:hypothetical protein